jgi:hypothetical protein
VIVVGKSRKHRPGPRLRAGGARTFFAEAEDRSGVSSGPLAAPPAEHFRRFLEITWGDSSADSAL